MMSLLEEKAAMTLKDILQPQTERVSTFEDVRAESKTSQGKELTRTAYTARL